jgi:curved DNA-binding protein CbpA
MKTKWFQNVKTLDELRTMYRKLALLHHPDRGGSTQNMQEINAEYEYLSKHLIDSNTDFSEGRKYYEHNASEFIRQKLDEILFLEEITIEIIGSWIWITGNTRPVKEELKQKGFRFSHNKTAWYWYYGDYHKFSKRQFSMDDIRAMWGSEEVEKQKMKNQLIF